MDMSAKTARQAAMAVLAKAEAGALAAVMPELPAYSLLRAPQVGAVMVRGRVAASGAPFNLGEMTVTRCSVRLECGAVGHAWVQGRASAHALNAALADALLQTDRAAEIQAKVIAPLQAAAQIARHSRAEKAAATKVDFFTMVRGEDQ